MDSTVRVFVWTSGYGFVDEKIARKRRVTQSKNMLDNTVKFFV